METTAIPLRILVVDQDSPSTRLLLGAIESAEIVAHVVPVHDLDEARGRLRADDINTVFIDPLSFGIEESSTYILEIREALPEIVFVLFHKSTNQHFRTIAK